MPRVAALAGLLLLLSACASAPRPDVFVVDLQPLAGGGLEQRMRVELRVQNPSNQPLAARGMSLRLIVNDQTLARGVSDAAFTVPPLGEATTSIVTSTTLVDLVRQVWGAQGRTRIDYRIEGRVYVEGGLRGYVPFESRGTLSPPQ